MCINVFIHHLCLDKNSPGNEKKKKLKVSRNIFTAVQVYLQIGVSSVVMLAFTCLGCNEDSGFLFRA